MRNQTKLGVSFIQTFSIILLLRSMASDLPRILLVQAPGRRWDLSALQNSEIIDDDGDDDDNGDDRLHGLGPSEKYVDFTCAM